ncbi:MAG: NfeD family protein [Burkholderiales bacterium]
MTESTVWWLLAGAIVAIELLTGTFYLLMLAIGLVAAALAAHGGASLTVQLLIAALVGGGAVVAWRNHKKASPALPASANHDVNLDIGETVRIEHWSADGSASVKYRGARWSVSLIAGATPSPGLHQIVEVVGSRLVVKPL